LPAIASRFLLFLLLRRERRAEAMPGSGYPPDKIRQEASWRLAGVFFRASQLLQGKGLEPVLSGQKEGPFPA